MKITIPFEVTINLKDYRSKSKIKKVSREVRKWLIDDLKNIYIPIENDTDMVVVKKIKTGKMR